MIFGLLVLIVLLTIKIKHISGDFVLQELHRPSEAAKHEVSKRCKDLANFMESIMEEVSHSNIQLDLPQELKPTVSVSLKKRVSVCFLFYFLSFLTYFTFQLVVEKSLANKFSN